MDQDILKKQIEQQILNKIVEDTLKYAEMCIADPIIYKKYRSRVLRIANDVIRNLNELIDESQ